MNLFNQCHTYHDENQELATKISDLEIENEYLEKGIWKYYYSRLR